MKAMLSQTFGNDSSTYLNAYYSCMSAPRNSPSNKSSYHAGIMSACGTLPANAFYVSWIKE